MLIGKQCKFGNGKMRTSPSFKSTEGVIMSNPHPVEDGDFIVLVQVADKLIRVDTDFIYGLENKAQ